MRDYPVACFFFAVATVVTLTSCREPSSSTPSSESAVQPVSVAEQPAEAPFPSKDRRPKRVDVKQPDVVESEEFDAAFFKRAYSLCEANQVFQSEQEYLKWVREFYEAKATMLTPAGWNEQSKMLLAKLDSAETGASVQALTDRLGRRIAVEWAKDRRASKIDAVNDLLKWGAAMKTAANQDDGTGQKILQTLTDIEREVASLVEDR